LFADKTIKATKITYHSATLPFEPVQCRAENPMQPNGQNGSRVRSLVVVLAAKQ